MADSLDELLADAKVVDDTEIALGERKFRVGDLRGRFKTFNDEKGQLTRERQEALERQQALETTLNLLREQGSRREQPIVQVQQPPAVDPNESLYEDPWTKGLLDRVDKRFTSTLEKQLQTALTPFGQWNEQVKQAMQQITRMGLELNARQTFAQHEWPEGYSPERAFKEAAERRLFDRNGLPDIPMLNTLVMQPIKEKKATEAAVKSALETARKEWEAERVDKERSRFRVLQKPSMFRPASTRKGAKAGEPPRSLQEWAASEESVPSEAEVGNMLPFGLGAGLR